MGFTSQDALIQAITTSGQAWDNYWNKNTLPTTAQAAGQWYDIGKGAGNPNTDAMIGSGVSLAWNPLTDSSTIAATTGATGGNITTTTFTDTTHGTGNFTVGMVLSGSGVTPGTIITALGTGTGQNNTGTYTIFPSNSTVTSQQITGTASSNFMYTGGSVSTMTKHVLNASAFSAAATTAPAIMMLVDLLGFYTINSVTVTGAQSLTGTPTLPRYASGKGVMAYLVPSIVMGAGTPTVQLTYTNPGSTSGRITPNFPALPTLNATSPVGAIPYTGTGAGKMGPFLPLAAGDNGILSVQSINFSATMTSGTMNLVLCKPLLTLPITTVGVAAERDLLNQLPSLPQIYDGACLNWLMYAGANVPTNSAFYGNLKVGWN